MTLFLKYRLNVAPYPKGEKYYRSKKSRQVTIAGKMSQQVYSLSNFWSGRLLSWSISFGVLFVHSTKFRNFEIICQYYWFFLSTVFFLLTVLFFHIGFSVYAEWIQIERQNSTMRTQGRFFKKFHTDILCLSQIKIWKADMYD